MPPKAKKRNANFNGNISHGNQFKKQKITNLDNASNEKVLVDQACEGDDGSFVTAIGDILKISPMTVTKESLDRGLCCHSQY